MENEIFLDDAVEVAKASLKDNNNNAFSEASEFVKKEKELIDDIISGNKDKEAKAYNSQKSQIEILNILNTYNLGFAAKEQKEENKSNFQNDIIAN